MPIIFFKIDRRADLSDRLLLFGRPNSSPAAVRFAIDAIGREVS